MRILLVDDEKNIRRALTVALESMGHEVTAVSGGAAATEEVGRGYFEAALVDLRLSEESGLDLLGELLRLSPRLAIILMTAYASIETAVEAMRRGAVDYLPKPCTPENLRQVLARIEKTRKMESKIAELESRYPADGEEPELSSASPVMQKVLDVAFRAADSEASVLLLGESGTGKSVLARAIHYKSPRHEKAFVTVSCPSLSRELLESELFGHAKGAFTGALTETWGKVAAADGGTLFLDEIGDLPFEIQSKLLRLLQEREFERVGETKPRRANVRIIAATNRDLKIAVSEGKFREDLFYRLNVITLQLPSLRDRVADIGPMALRFLRQLASRSSRTKKSLSPEALRLLESYAWPGNLREMRNVMERAIILSHADVIEVGDVSDTISPSATVRLGGPFTLAEVEGEHIRRVVAQAPTLDRAAEVLGIDPATLYRRRKKTGVEG